MKRKHSSQDKSKKLQTKFGSVMIGCQRVSKSGLARVKFKKHFTWTETAPSSQLSSAKLLLIIMLEKDYHDNEVRKVKDLMCEEDGYEESDIFLK